MIYKKTIVLTGIKNSAFKAVLNIQKDHGEVSGDVRLYNTQSNFDGILTLGLLDGQTVHKAVLKIVSESFYKFSFNIISLPDVFTCAIMHTHQGTVMPLLVGASNGKTDKSLQTKLAESLAILDEKPTLSTEKPMQSLVACANECQNSTDCLACKYRKAFYEEEKLNNDNDVLPTQQPLSGFYKELMPQLDNLFEKYGSFKDLENIVPSSKWVKVEIENTDNYYVVGVISENDNIKYVCYGVPGLYAIDPPKELENISKWLPLDPLRPFESGYWIIYQNAETGENENIEIV